MAGGERGRIGDGISIRGKKRRGGKAEEKDRNFAILDDSNGAGKQGVQIPAVPTPEQR